MMSQTIAIIDYDMGNLHSVAKALVKVVDRSSRVIVVTEPKQLLAADRVVFPGVGAIKDCMCTLQARDWVFAIEQALQQKPFLAICVGLQALMQHSTENEGVDCLGFFSGQVQHLSVQMPANVSLKVPHMGWNQVSIERSHVLWNNISNLSRFYFVHSYFVKAQTLDVRQATVEYGHQFDCVLAKDNVFAVQFHPEKSQRHGLQLLQNFVQWKVE